MIINDYVLMELNQQRRAQVAADIAALRAKDPHRRWTSALRRDARTAPTTRPVTTAIALDTGSTAR